MTILPELEVYLESYLWANIFLVVMYFWANNLLAATYENLHAGNKKKNVFSMIWNSAYNEILSITGHVYYLKLIFYVW